MEMQYFVAKKHNMDVTKARSLAHKASSLWRGGGGWLALPGNGGVTSLPRAEGKEGAFGENG